MEDMQDLIDWLEDERTRDLVDLINRAAHGKPVDEAAERYKRRYRHDGSLDRLSDMFESLEERRDSSIRLTINSVQRQIDACLDSVEESRQRFSQNCSSQLQPDPEDLGALQQLADRLLQLGDASSQLRELVIRAGSASAAKPSDNITEFTRRRA